MKKFSIISILILILLFAFPGLAADPSYQAKVYHELGGEREVVASGGTIAVESGGILNIESGGYFKIGGTPVTATAADLNSTSALTGTTQTSFTVDSDATTGKIKIQPQAGAANKTMTLQNAALTDDRVITFPNQTGTVSLSASTSLTAGADGTAGTVTIYPATAANGTVVLSAADSVANKTLTLTNAAQGQDTTLVFPDIGAARGQIPAITSDHSVLITAGADRTVSLGGNISTGGALTTAGTLTTGGNVTFSGAFNTTLTVPETNTWALPVGGGTLAVATGAETGTTANTFTVDSDNITGKLKLQTTTGGTNHTVTITNSTTTADRTITLPDLAGTVAILGGTQTFSGNKTFTGTVDIQGNTTASAGNPTFDLSGSSGTFTTSTGANVLSGNTSIAGTKTFGTGTGAVSLNGDTTIATNKNLVMTAGTGYIQVNGATSGAIKILPIATGTATTTIQNQNVAAATITLPLATAELATLGLSETLNTKILTNAGAITQTGATTITSGTTGIVIPDANTAGLAIHAASGKGYVQIKAVDSTGDTATIIQNDLQAGARTLTIPDQGNAAGSFVLSDSANMIKFTAAASRTLALGGNVTSAGALDLGDHALTLNTGGATTLTLPTSGTLATLTGTEALTGKTISGDNNTVSNIGPASPKIGVVGVRGGAVPVASIPLIINFSMDATAGSSTWTNATGQTFRFASAAIYKTNGASASAVDTVQIFNGANAITDAVALNVADQAVVNVGTINDAYVEVINGGTLIVTTVLNTDCSVNVAVTGMLK